MNKKKTNYLVIILNIIVVIFTYIFKFAGSEILNPCFMAINTEAKSIYNNQIMDFFVTHSTLIMIIIHSILALLNIICAIQNKKDKKICFWQLLFGLYEVYYVGYLTDILDSYIFGKWGNKIIFAVIPIILAIRNFICVRKNGVSRIKIISYIGTIIIAVLTILNVFNMLTLLGIYWEIIILIMLFIYIHKQENIQEESKIRKVTNIILYYALQLVTVILISILLISLIALSKIHENKWKNETIKIYNNIVELNGITNEELYMPVQKNGKYGFINEKGQEKIQCEYDRVTYFIKANIKNKDCYFALVEKEGKYYIISKNNSKIDVSDQYYLKSIDDKFKKALEDNFNYTYIDISTTYFSYSLIGFGQVNEDVTFNMEDMQQLLVKDNYNSIELEKSNYENEFIYNSEKYTLTLEMLESEDTDYEEKNFRVTLKMNDGEKIITATEHLPTYSSFRYSDEIYTYSDGSIPFESIDGTIKGFYDVDGNKISFKRKSDDYKIVDVKDDKIIIEVNEEDEEAIWTESKYCIYDKTGKLYIKTNKVEYLNDIYLIVNEENKMILYDKNINKISDKYDRILPNGTLEVQLFINEDWKN